MRIAHRFLTAATASLIIASTTNAAILVEYDIANAKGSGASVLTSDAAITASTIAPTSTLTPLYSSYTGALTAKKWEQNLNLNKYFEFTLNIAPSTTVNFDTISLSLLRGNYGGKHGAESWEIRTSQDNYASTLASFDISGSAYDHQVSFTNTDISKLAPQTGDISFRIYGYNAEGSSDFSGLTNTNNYGLTGCGSNLIVTGSTSIPTPATGSLILLGSPLLLLMRKRRT